MFKKILIANRGEIAVRVAKTAKRMGVATVAVYSDADANAPHVKVCDEAIHIGPAAATESYLRSDKILAAINQSGAQAVHPGYGFLSENAEFADALNKAGVAFIGPTAETIRAMGSKSAAKDLMETANVPTTPGYQGEDQSVETFKKEAGKIGYPVLLKATAGGGGKGMRMVEKESDLEDALHSAQREAKSAFGDDRFLIEKFIARARHVEVQIFGDGTGNVVHMFERDCSLQRRHQKVIEEAPAPDMPAEVRQKLLQAGVDAGRAVNYRGAGTVEFLYDPSSEAVFFMEMNTRLQVEHPVSEMITGHDFVEWQLRIAAGEGLPMGQEDIQESGHAFESRLYAENPDQNFSPSIGTISTLNLPEAQSRVDSGVRQGQVITPFYDPMIAKIITHGNSRKEALGAMRAALSETHVAGLETNAAFLHALTTEEDFIEGDVSTRFIEEHETSLFAKDDVGPILWAIAALWKQQQESADNSDPWYKLTGFRLNRPSHEVMWVDHDDQAAVLRLKKSADQYKATLEPGASAARRREKYEAVEPIEFAFSGEIDETGMARIFIGGQNVVAFAAPHMGGLRIWVGAQHWDVRFPDPLQGTAASQSSAGSLTAPMPGVITMLSAKPGDTVASGKPLLVMEAMKMEHVIKAPFDGVVKAYRFGSGDQVKDGDLLVDFEESE